MNIETGMNTTYRFRVIQKFEASEKTRRVKCYHSLLVSENPNTGAHGVFVVFLIATSEYNKSHKGILSDWFDNTGNMGDFSGLKLYCNLNGKLIRVNKYVNGEKVSGIFLPWHTP